MSFQQSFLAEVFKDAATHKEVAGIISTHLTNTVDIREKALEGLNIGQAKTILDLGCGYGFFSSALIGRLNPGSKITGIDKHREYEPYYMNCCRKDGVEMAFNGGGIHVIRELESNSIDLIICSYALYFFAEMTCEISRILKNEGMFIAITHAQPHMQEFTQYVRKILKNNGIVRCNTLPYEDLISNFSDKTGPALLGSCFDKILVKPYKSSLVFEKNDFNSFRKYFTFKKNFFLPRSCQADLDIIQLILNSVQHDLSENHALEITKDDVIYICTKPVT
jgi:ubiquinone/menaquinone biosynthesis C-methylase UbiE